MALTKAMLRAGVGFLGQAGAPAVARTAIAKWNALLLAGDLERARSQIKLEFLRNRDLARLIYEKHRADMSDEVASLFEEMMEDG